LDTCNRRSVAGSWRGRCRHGMTGGPGSRPEKACSWQESWVQTSLHWFRAEKFSLGTNFLPGYQSFVSGYKLYSYVGINVLSVGANTIPA
jgi:hypothetical protein